MTREAKIGLILGLGAILVVGIIVSDQLSGPVNTAAPGLPGTEIGGGMSASRTAGATPSVSPADLAAANPASANPANSHAPAPIPSPDEAELRQPQPQPAGSPAQPGPTTVASGAATQPGTGIVSQPSGNLNAPTLPQPGRPSSAQPAQPGAAPQPPRNPAPAASGQTVHVVKPNDNLWDIAITYYGQAGPTTRQRIKDANRSVLRGSDRLNIGMKLVIPKAPARTASNTAPQPTGASTAPRSRTTVAAGGARTIKVGPRDTLSELALKHMGTSKLWPQLLQANRDQMRDPRDLREGMTLRIPQVSRSASPAAPAPRTASTARGKVHVVRQGETLSSISRRYFGNLSQTDAIYMANRRQMRSPDDLAVGQKLLIP